MTATIIEEICECCRRGMFATPFGDSICLGCEHPRHQHSKVFLRERPERE